MHFVERRDTVVPFQQRRSWTNQLDRPRVQLPHRINHRMVVRIEDVFLELRVPGDVNLRHSLMGNAVE